MITIKSLETEFPTTNDLSPVTWEEIDNHYAEVIERYESVAYYPEDPF